MERQRIAELFGQPRPRYSKAELMRVLSATDAEIEGWIATGIVEPAEDESFAWADAAYLALHVRGTRREVVAELAAAGIEVPPFNRTIRTPVELPVYQVALLAQLASDERAAGRAGVTASDVLEEMIALALEDRVEAEPFAANAKWPLGDDA